MNRRFESTIAAAVMAGAITLTGCGSSGGGGGSTPGDSTVAFWGARAIDSKHLKLYFSDALTIPDSATVAGLFTLHKTSFTSGFAYQSLVNACKGAATTTGGSNIRYYSCLSYTTLVTAVTPQSTADSGAAIGSVVSAKVSTDDASVVVLTLSSAIPSGADDGTGVLRLTYSGGTDGIQDEAGDVLAEAAIPSGQKGNVATTNTGPVMVAAKTIDSRTVQLTFSHPVDSSDLTTLAGDFSLRGTCFYSTSSPGNSTYKFTNYTALGPKPYLTKTGNFSVTVRRNPFFSTYSTPSSSISSFSDASIPSDAPNTLVLKLPGAIPDMVDYNGYLRLTYTSRGSEALKADDGGTAAGPITQTNTDRGNVKDTVGSKGSHACPAPG